MAKYDSAGALEVLGVYAEQKDPASSHSLKEQAAQELLRQLAALDGQMVDLSAGADPRFRGPTVAVSLSFAGARVTYLAGRDRFVVFTGDDNKVEVQLHFNRVRGVFEGMQFESARAPAPGELIERRRDALVVLAEAIVEVMKKEQ